jgi:hypothetical protein
VNEFDDHLDPETVYLLLEGALETDEAVRARAHLDTCGLCQVEVRMARSFAETSSAPVDEGVARRLHQRVMAKTRGSETPAGDRGAVTAPHVRRVRRGRWIPRARITPRWWIGSLLAAGIAAIAVGLWQTRPDSPTQGGVLRTTHPAEVWQLRVEPTEDGWDVRWQAQPDVEHYTVRVQAPSGRIVWSKRSDETSARILRDELSTVIQPDEDYFVSVLTVHLGVERSSEAVRLPPGR